MDISGGLFVGGGIDKGETPEKSAIRETKEEVGLDIFDLKRVGSIVSNRTGKVDNIEIFYAKVVSFNYIMDEFEIEEVRWFSKEDFPKFGSVSNEIWEVFMNTKYEK